MLLFRVFLGFNEYSKSENKLEFTKEYLEIVWDIIIFYSYEGNRLNMHRI